MKKKRGLRKYYKKLSDSSVINNLDFSGGDSSWFDLYHIHIGNSGLGNISWRSRKQHLSALFSIAGELEEKLKTYSKNFQYWILISENNSFEDSIYIHTSNPNNSEFPISVGFDNNYEGKNTKLFDFLSQKDYKVNAKLSIEDNVKDEVYYYLTKNELGMGLK